MFGFSKEAQLKKEILYYLDRQTDFVSSQEIASEIGNITSQTILKYIKELEISLTEKYEPTEMSLRVNKRFGIRLYRYNTNFNRILEVLLVESPVYEIFKALLQHRQVVTLVLCDKLEISLSNLKRIIKRVNQSIEMYDLRITIGTNIKIIGKESSIRSVFFLFFYHVHRSYSNIPWINNDNNIVKAQKICSVLYISENPILIEIIALWLFICEESNRQGYELETMYLAVYFNDSIIEKHASTEMTLEEWYFFLMCLYALDILNLTFFMNFEKIHNNHYSDLAKVWMACYEKYFEPLVMEEQIWTRLSFQKCAILEKFHLINPELTSIFSPINYREIYDRYPSFMKKFEYFFSEVSVNIDKEHEEFFRRKSLELCLRFVSPKQMAMNVSVHLMTTLTSEAANHMKRQLKNNFSNKINLNFTDDFQAAELILTTEEFAEGVIPNDKEVLVIRPVLSSQDLRFLEKYVYQWRKTHCEFGLEMTKLM